MEEKTIFERPRHNIDEQSTLKSCFGTQKDFIFPYIRNKLDEIVWFAKINISLFAILLLPPALPYHIIVALPYKAAKMLDILIKLGEYLSLNITKVDAKPSSYIPNVGMSVLPVNFLSFVASNLLDILKH